MGRPSTGPSAAVKRDADTVRLLDYALLRARPVAMAPSLRRQTLVVTRLALTNRRAGAEVLSPIVADLAKAAGCKLRQARDNLRTLERWGALILRKEGGGTAAAIYAFDGEALFRVLVVLGCNPGEDLRKGLRPPENHRFLPPPPRHYTPALTPAVGETLPPAVGSVIPSQFQTDSANENPRDRISPLTPALTPAVGSVISLSAQCDSANENSNALQSFPIYGALARADFLPSLAPPSRTAESAGPEGETAFPAAARAEPSQRCWGNRQAGMAAPFGPPSHLREPLAGRSAVASLFPLSEKNAGRGACAEVPEGSARVTLSGLSDDARSLIDHLTASGPASYGAAASSLGWGATRAWVAEAELRAEGLVRLNHLGFMALADLD